MKKSDKIFIIVFIGIVTFSLLYLFQASYAKYRRQATGDIQARIASWNIKVNNETIINKTTLTSDIIPVIDTNPYVKEDVIAPGTTGYFDIIINATNVDVDFTYTITLSVDEDTPLTDLVITGYKLNNGTLTTYNSTTGIVGDITMNTSQTTIRVYFEWDDSATNNMNNAEDTEYAQTAEYQNTKIKVTIHFEQKR